MQSSQEMSSEAKDSLGDQVNESLGINPETTNEPEELPELAKKRLGMQEKRHKKELRKMQEQINEMSSRLNSREEPQPNPSGEMGYVPNNQLGMDDQIRQAVLRAMQLKDEHEQQAQKKARDAENIKHIHNHYKNLQDHLDKASEKYEDFDDVVKDDSAPYSDHIRDAALLIPNPADVLYKLGKDRTNLKRISELPPMEQAKEVIKLSMALMTGNENSKSESTNSRPLGNVKNNPITSKNVTEATPVSELRKRMRDGWK